MYYLNKHGAKIQNISPIKRRILQFVETLGISKRAFYLHVGISRGTLESETGITEEVLAKFIAAYSDISIEWLITGKGSMLQDAMNIKKTNSEDITDMQKNINTLIETNSQLVKLINESIEISKKDKNGN